MSENILRFFFFTFEIYSNLLFSILFSVILCDYDFILLIFWKQKVLNILVCLSLRIIVLLTMLD